VMCTWSLIFVVIFMILAYLHPLFRLWEYGNPIEAVCDGSWLTVCMCHWMVCVCANDWPMTSVCVCMRSCVHACERVTVSAYIQCCLSVYSRALRCSGRCRTTRYIVDRNQLRTSSTRSDAASSSWRRPTNVCRRKPSTFAAAWTLTVTWRSSLMHSINSSNSQPPTKMTSHSKTSSPYLSQLLLLAFT